MRLTILQTVWVCALTLFAVCHPLSGQDTDTKSKASPVEALKDSLQKELDGFVTDNSFPGSTLSVVLPDGKTISLASGVADRDKKDALQPGARMFAGSTGKVIVSAVALTLVDEGKLKLDDKVVSYLTDDGDSWVQKLPNAKDLTIRSLMNHTSGLPRYIFQQGFLQEIRKNPYRDWTPVQCMEYVLEIEPTSAVGKGWSYADTNYILLGIIIERVSGKDFYQLAAETLIEPMKLANTIPSTQPKLEGLTQGHVGPQNFLGMPEKTLVDGKYAVNPAFEWCGGGFITNTTDLARIVKAIHASEMLRPETHKQLVQAVDFRSGQNAERGYGLGTFVWKTEGGTFFGHAGIMPGHLTQVEYSQEGEFAIAIQTNTDATMGQRHHGAVQAVARLVEAYLASQ